jgi:hypothetical protein
MAGNTVQVGSDNKIRVSTGSGLVVGGASDPCCCTAACTCCLPTESTVSVVLATDEVCTAIVGCANNDPFCFPASTSHQNGYSITSTFAAGTYTLSYVSGSGCQTTNGSRSRIYEVAVNVSFVVKDLLWNLCTPDATCQSYTKAFILRATYQVTKTGATCSRQYDVNLLENDTDASFTGCGPCSASGTITLSVYESSWQKTTASACDPVSGPHTLTGSNCSVASVTLDDI